MRKKHSGGEGGGGGHDGGGSLRWLLTYADMITLLMAFFIMMYSMSVINIAKFQAAAISIRSGFGGSTKGQGRSILGTNGQVSVKPSPIAGDTTGVAWQIIKPVHDYVKQTPLLKKTVQMFVDRRGIVLRLCSDKVMFRPGSADILPQAFPILSKIAGVIHTVPNAVRVEGHTCNLPTNSDLYPSNWELSTTRATNVVRFLIDKQRVPPNQLSATGYADTRPLVPNDSEEHRGVNRHVDFIIVTDPKE